MLNYKSKKVQVSNIITLHLLSH